MSNATSVPRLTQAHPLLALHHRIKGLQLDFLLVEDKMNRAG